jgi:hypothetical protein
MLPRAPLTVGSRTISVPQLSVTNSNSSQRPNFSSPLTAHQPTHFIPLYSQSAPLHSRTQLNFGEEHIENTSSNSTSIVAYGPLLCCLFQGDRLTRVYVYMPIYVSTCRLLFVNCFMLVSPFAYSSNLKIEATFFSEMSAEF